MRMVFGIHGKTSRQSRLRRHGGRDARVEQPHATSTCFMFVAESVTLCCRDPDSMPLYFQSVLVWLAYKMLLANAPPRFAAQTCRHHLKSLCVPCKTIDVFLQLTLYYSTFTWQTLSATPHIRRGLHAYCWLATVVVFAAILDRRSKFPGTQWLHFVPCPFMKFMI